ncbi:hypothetical protein Tco_1055540 [Tanacetum coccineum]|uniref:Uncharacterized protein n=1 Tax=Tanacetum coccineum TaxID=301880 RepID=A0ABQ5GZY0_9ASTR
MRRGMFKVKTELILCNLQYTGGVFEFSAMIGVVSVERRLVGCDGMQSRPGWSPTPTILFPSGLRARTRCRAEKIKWTGQAE